MTADLFINGQAICHHEGGYSTFRADLTPYLKDQNDLEIRVDNSPNDHVYPQMADFTFYGGLYRDVNLIIVPDSHFELEHEGTPGIRVTPLLKENTAEITVETWQNTRDCVTMTLGDLRIEAVSEQGCAKGVFILENPHLWQGLKDPFLYEVSASLPSGDTITSTFGIRSFHIDPQKGFFLNGVSYPLRGVSRHQDRLGIGSALSPDDQTEDMDTVIELGANTLRLAHYQHSQEFYDLCDAKGIIVWAEIPYITKHMSKGKSNAQSQMLELIT